MRKIFLSVVVLIGLHIEAAEKHFDFDSATRGKQPAGFQSIAEGGGGAGDWQVIEGKAPGSAGIDATNANAGGGRLMLAQLARIPLDNHVPILVYDEGNYDDFRFTTRFKIVGGAEEQAAGVVFRFQNVSNYYEVFASSAGNTLRCYKVSGGILKPPFGADMIVAKDVWHEMTVECEGSRILCALDGNAAIKLIDNSSAGVRGKIGFCTRADSVCYFSDSKITYTPHESLSRSLVSDTLNVYSELLGLKLFAARAPGEIPSIVASTDEKEIGEAGTSAEQDVIKRGVAYFGRDKKSVYVTLPLLDRNGDPIAAVRVVMKTFPGQTEENAMVRARPVVKRMQKRVQSLEDLLR